MKTPTDPVQGLPDANNASESALRKTLQKLLKKRSTKASKKLEKDLQSSNSKWQLYTQRSAQDSSPAVAQAKLDGLPSLRQPRQSADHEEVYPRAVTAIEPHHIILMTS